ncbi:MAG TPA: sensor histidine kinase [Anaerolineales bacterium]|nr:sensor histidine kinase [Anaerolineales bacterium]
MKSMARNWNRTSYIGGILFIIVFSAQSWLDPMWELHPWLVGSLEFVFFLFYISEPWIIRRFPKYIQLYLAVQTSILGVLLLWPPGLNTAPILYMVLIFRVMPRISATAGFLWMGIFIALVLVGLGLDEGWFLGPIITLLYSAVYLFVNTLAVALRQLEDAHQQLQASAFQAEEMAAAQERNRLARNLHDSVTQTIFSMTLAADTARIQLDHDPAQVAFHLERLQQLAQSALSEMRSLVFELRPAMLSEAGLIVTLNQHLETLEKQHGLTVMLQTDGDEVLPNEQESHLFRIVQEALNNIVKHAHTARASVVLKFRDDRISLQILDEGKGFDLDSLPMGEKHMGLSSMRERVEMLGGTFQLDSHPGEGTRILIDIPH